MTTILDRIDRTRRLCFANNNQYSDIAWLQDINYTIKDLQQTIDSRVDDGYFWDIWIEDLVSWQDEYRILEAIWPTQNLKIRRIEKVYVKYSWSTEYVQSTLLDIFHLTRDIEYYKTNASKTAPFFYMRDNSFFLYPTEDTTDTFTNGSWDIIEWVQDWLKIHFKYVHSEVILTTTDDEMKIPQDYLHLLDIWIKQYIYSAQGKINDKNDAIIEYNNAKELMVSTLNEKYRQPQPIRLDYTHLRRFF